MDGEDDVLPATDQAGFDQPTANQPRVDQLATDQPATDQAKLQSDYIAIDHLFNLP